MATVDASNKQLVAPISSNESVLLRATYDNSVDSGTLSDKVVLLECSATEDCVITEYWIEGEVEFNSAGNGASIDVGIEGGDEDILSDGVLEASISAGSLIQPTIVEGTPNVMPMPLKLAAGGKIVMTILGEDLTAGKADFVFKASKYS